MSTVIVDLLAQVDTQTAAYVTSGYAALVNKYSTQIQLVVACAVAFFGWKTLYHPNEFSMGNFIKMTVKIAVVYSLATNWAFFSTYVYDVLTNGPNEIAGSLMQSAGSNYDSSNSALQALFDQGMSNGMNFWDEGDWRHWLYLILGMDIWLVTGVLTGVAITMIVIAKIFLSILIVLAPVFIPMLFADSFRGVTESWLKLCLGFALVPLMVDSALLFTNGIIEKGMESLAGLATSGDTLQVVTGVVLFDIGVILCCVLLYRAAELAAQIGGGMAVSTLQTTGALKGLTNLSPTSKVSGWLNNKGKVASRENKARWTPKK